MHCTLLKMKTFGSNELDGLTPQELYYLIVLGEDEIYTSSYLNVYKRIFQRMRVPRSDSLLMSVNGDYFRKFIKMAAGYNTLNDFLAKMDNGKCHHDYEGICDQARK